MAQHKTFEAAVNSSQFFVISCLCIAANDLVERGRKAFPMLSLLSLLLASGTVLKADTERWTPQNYPNPRRNHTGCNTWENSTLCDPDHILTDQWRAQINENIRSQMTKLTNANVTLAEKAPAECQNQSERITIYVLLAKQIWTPNNQSITGNDLTNFGDELAQRYGLNDLPCKTFLLLIGIEAAKLAYVRTGKDLRLPADLMQRVFHEYKLFNAKNFMAGLNKIIDEIGTQLDDPFKERTQTTASTAPANATDTAATSLAEIVNALMEKNGHGEGGPNGSTKAAPRGGQVDGEVRVAGREDQQERTARQYNGTPMVTAQWWMFFALGSAILISFGSLALLAMVQQRQRERRQMRQNITNSSNGQHPKLTTLGGKDTFLVEVAKKKAVPETKRAEREKGETRVLETKRAEREKGETRVLETKRAERENEEMRVPETKRAEGEKDEMRVLETKRTEGEKEEMEVMETMREEKKETIKKGNDIIKRKEENEEEEGKREENKEEKKDEEEKKQKKEREKRKEEEEEKKEREKREEEEEGLPRMVKKEDFFSEKLLTDATDRATTLLHWHTVRIGAADLATDVI
ncbi:hypothetical protein niasHS_002353 [Heterodera schachtii]|uniref:Uncharacterized protein n=1 Tax=Heterodera schachtii TaxID=97005 RepID=A0ABD2KK72_HETSC